MTIRNLTAPSKYNTGWKIFGLALLINTVQSVFSTLLNDEPYYWLYSKNLSWGYFDHPPMIALLVKIGSGIFQGEIGVRLLVLLAGSFTFFLIYKLIEGEAEKLVIFKVVAVLLFSSLFLNLYSFPALPDTPMLFFAALFLLAYRRFITSENLINALLLGGTAALLLYSKYHGILLIGFTVLSNIRLLKRPLFYLVLITALILFIPHINWQFQHDFPTLRFQFFERASVFKLDNVLSYIGEQAAVTGPIMLLLFSLLYKPKNQFQKTLKFNVAGIFLFFLLSSFKENVNVHWTAIAWPPMLCLAYLYIENLKKYRKLTFGLLLTNLLLVIILRLDFIAGIFPLSNFNDKHPELLVKTLQSASNGRPLIFIDMYNEPSDYMFYSQQESYAVNSINYKKTQFNYLPKLEESFEGKDVAIVSKNPLNANSRPISIKKGKQYYLTPWANFTSFSTNIKVTATGFKNLYADKNHMIKVSIENTLSGSEKALLTSEKAYLTLNFINNITKENYTCRYNDSLDISSNKPFDFFFKAPDKKGTYNCVFSIVTPRSVIAGFNSNIYRCKVE